MSTTQLPGTARVQRAGAPRLCLRLVGGDPVVIEVWGDLAAGTGHLLTELVEHVISAGPTTVVLDLSHTRPLCADGLQVLGLAQAMIVAAGARVCLRGTVDHMRPADPTRPRHVLSAGAESEGA
jgi:anti-anti-sigma regulatory factor